MIVEDGAGAALDPHVLANGSITGLPYKSYFGVANGGPSQTASASRFCCSRSRS